MMTFWRCLWVVGMLGQMSVAMPGILVAMPSNVWLQSPLARQGERAVRAQGRTVTLTLENVQILEALQTIVREVGGTLVFDGNDSILKRELSTRGRFRFSDEPIANAISAVLKTTKYEGVFSTDGRVLMIKQSQKRPTVTDTSKVGIITGRVNDSATRSPLVGATVGIPGVNRRVLTNEKGIFVIKDVPAGSHVVHVRYIGYQSASQVVTIDAGKSVVLNVVLAASASVLSGVVTTATGAQRKVEVGNDITTINVPDVIQKTPVSTVTEILETRVPGLIVGRTSGEPGAKNEMRIRGTNSIRASNEPIVIVDGVQVIGDRAGVDPTGFETSPINQLDVNAISTIEVLKGPSAVALYGSNAANGVIVITTKRGHDGPLRWNMMADVSQETMPGTWPLNYYAWGEDLTAGRGTVHCPRFGGQAGNSVNWGNFPLCRYDSTTVYQVLNDPSTTVFGKGFGKTLMMGASGGNRQIAYSFTGTSRSTQGLLKLPDADVRLLNDAGLHLKSWQRRPQALSQYQGSANLRFQLNEQSELTYTTAVIREDKQSTPLVSVLRSSVEMEPPVILYDQNGVPVGKGSGVIAQVPSFMAGNKLGTVRFSNAANYRTTLWKALTVEASVGIDASNGRETYLWATGDKCALRAASGALFEQCSEEDESPAAQNIPQYRSIRSSQLVADAHFRASGTPKGHRWLNVTPFVGLDLNSNSSGIADISAFQLPPGGQSILGAGSIKVNGDRYDTRRTAGMFAEARVNIANRLWLPFSVRTDAGNALGSLSRPTFPKLGFSYLVSDEPNFRSIPVFGKISELRLRTGFGIAGRQPGLVDKYRTYNFSPYPVENIVTDIVTVNSVGNTKLSPEFSREWEFGFDATAIDNSRTRLSGTFTVAQRHTSNLLTSEDLPPSIGLKQQRINNLGDVENRSIEATIEGFQRLGRFDWNTVNTFSTEKGRLLRLSDGFTQQVPEFGSGEIIVDNNYRVGYPLNGLWAFPVLSFIDGDGDGQIQSSEVMFGDSLQYLGTPTPRFTFASNNQFTIASRLTVTAALQYEGGSVPRSDNLQRSSKSRAMNDPTLSLEEQTKYRYDAFSSAYRVSTLRLTSVQLTYNFQTTYISRFFGARSLQVAVSGTNLGLWSTFSGKDPGVGGINRIAGFSVLPTPRTYRVSMRVQ